MNNDFVADILRATAAIKSGDPAGVSTVIEKALTAAGLTPVVAPGTAAPVNPWQPGSAAWQGWQPATQHGQRLRKPLGEVLRTLEAGRERLLRDGLPHTRAPDLPLPEGAEFRDLLFSNEAGARRYRLYVPASAADGLQGLIVMLHGCTQNPEDFAAGTGMNALAETHRLLIAYPAQTGGENAMSCWNWFRPGDQVRGAGEPAIIAGLTEAVRAEFAVPRDRVFIAGLSAGGAMAAVMAETYPDLYAAVGIHSGLPYGCANDVMSAFSAMGGQAGIAAPPPYHDATGRRPRTIVFHGGADTTVHPVNAERIVSGLPRPSDRAATTVQSPAGTTRGYARTVIGPDDGPPILECWIVDGAEHAWSGGDPRGTYTDPSGPDASAAMVGFFLGVDRGTTPEAPQPRSQVIPLPPPPVR